MQATQLEVVEVIEGRENRGRIVIERLKTREIRSDSGRTLDAGESREFCISPRQKYCRLTAIPR